MDILADARQLADFVTSLNDFRISSDKLQFYDHMGATITDSILQAGVNYRTVVEPRVRQVLRRYPEAKTSGAFLAVIERHGADCVLNWRHPEKPRRLYELTTFLVNLNLETEQALQGWLLDPYNCEQLLQLKGIGPKTIDYLKRFVGISTIAVDRHVRRFLNFAGVQRDAYDEIQQVVAFAADLLRVSRSNFDHAIWSYSSEMTRTQSVANSLYRDKFASTYVKSHTSC
jgi:hypothetical protein